MAAGLKHLDALVEEKKKVAKKEYKKLSGAVSVEKVTKVNEICDELNMTLDECMEAVADTIIDVYGPQAAAARKDREAEEAKEAQRSKPPTKR